MGLVVGLGIGVGLTLVWLALTSPVTPRQRRGSGRLQVLLHAAGLNRTTPRQLVGLSAMSGTVGFVALQTVSRTVTVSVAFAALAAYLPIAVVSGRARARQRELAQVWPDAVDNVASAVRAGLSLPEALSQLADRGPEPLRPPFRSFAGDYQATGRFGASLDRLKVELADPVGDRVVEGIRVAREVGGGDLGRLLRNLSAHLRDDLRTRAELESRQAWTINGARLAVSAPWLVLLMLSFQREVITRYASTTGAVVLLGGGALCLFSYRLMLRLGRLPVERRVLS